MEAKLLSGVLQNDMHQRLQIGDQLIEYIRSDDTDLDEFEEFEKLMAGLVGWMNSSNSKVSILAMDVLIAMVVKMKEQFRPHIATVLPAIRERLGDAKDNVREKTQVLVQQIMQDSVTSPQVFLDRILEGTLVHKNWRVKEQGLVCLSRTLLFFGSGQVSVSKFVGKICDLLGDASAQVRTTAMECMVEIYRHVGVKVRIDLSKRNLPPAKLQALKLKFDELDAMTNARHSDEDGETVSSYSSSSSFSQTQAHVFTVPTSVPATSKRKAAAVAVSGGGSGAVDEDDFHQAFSDYPAINIFTQSDVEKVISSVSSTLSNTNMDWSVRLASLKELRAVAQCESLDHHAFLPLLRTLEHPLISSLKDLRSQVVREACVTISCLAVTLGSDFAPFSEFVLPMLMTLLPNSAKVMATSAEVCLKFILKHSPGHRQLPPICNTLLTSKSAISRKRCVEMLLLITQNWDSSLLERHCSLLEEVLQKGMKDSDPSVRKTMRRIFWCYHAYFPGSANKLLDSLDSQQQRHLNEERGHEEGGTGQVSILQSRPLKKASTLGGHTELKTVDTLASLPPRPPSSNDGRYTPSIRVQRPTIRNQSKPLKKGDSSLSSIKKMSRSSENLISDDSGVHYTRPSSRSGTAQRSVLMEHGSAMRAGTPTRRSSRPIVAHSPTGSRDASPIRKVSSISRKGSATLPSELLRMNFMGMDDDDDTASVTSERSTFSMSSEMSISGYASYPHPVTDVDELQRLCSSKQWSERRDGIVQLHLLLESSRSLSQVEMTKVKNIFKKLFAEPNIKVYGLFLETLSRFIEDHRKYLDDWLFLLLLRLLHKQSSEMLKSVHFKLQLVLENVRRSFDTDQQFHELCRILIDQTQPMNSKVKLAWLEYVQELVPMMDPADFRDDADTRLSFTKLLSLTVEKGPDIRRSSRLVVVGLFDLNAATWSLLLRSVPRNLQENANRIVRGHMQDSGSSEEGESPQHSLPAKTAGQKHSASASVHKMSAPLSPRTAENHVSRSSLAPTLARITSISTPDVSQVGLGSPQSRLPRSRLPIPSGQGTPSGRATPSRIPMPRSGSRQAAHPPRAYSVDPDRMLNTAYNPPVSREKYQRPTSSQSEYAGLGGGMKRGYTNGLKEVQPRPPSSQGFMLDQFISTLPPLDFGSPDPDEKDQIGLLLKELDNAASPKNRTTTLQTLFHYARTYNASCWKEHITEAFVQLVELLKDKDGGVRCNSLRLMKEILRRHPSDVSEFSDQLIARVLEAYADTDCNVNVAAEEMFGQLAVSLPTKTIIDQLIPATPRPSDATSSSLLGVIKFLSKVVGGASNTDIQANLEVLMPTILKGYSHEESVVRKASVYCLVELYGTVGEDIRPYLSGLSSSQNKLLDLYIKRSQSRKASPRH